MHPVTVTRGSGPIVLGMPHTGTYLPDEVRAVLNARGLTLSDTDWHIDRLYDGLLPDVTVVRATFHRYVIDANRDPSGQSLYPGQNTTGLCPLTDFDGNNIYLDGQEPDVAEIERRRLAYHTPYHEALEAELQRVRKIHGAAILYDCHSIRSLIPFLFDGALPDFNIGTNDGTTCAPEIERVTKEVCETSTTYTSILNGRFKGGWTTRHYGRPTEGMHAIQMELAQINYLQSEGLPFDYDPERAERLRQPLKTILQNLTDIAASGALRAD